MNLNSMVTWLRRLGVLVVFSWQLATSFGAEDESPNIVVIFCDDLGYGDLGAFGHPTIRTPNLDRMAAEGQKWTNFYVGASVCTPSRAALMTGRLPIRSGMCSDKRRVLFPNSGGGLPDDEFTIAEVLRSSGYRTACVGKWHLGHLQQFLPTNHGFDRYFGIPYSNDMDRVRGAPNYRQHPDLVRSAHYNVPLLRNTQIVERPAEQTTITRRYAEESVRFVRENSDVPFFLYLAHSLPHIPLFRSTEFVGHSLRGIYGDVIEEIDSTVGKILEAVRGLDRKTLVVFTSDNGPWLTFDELGGSAGLLRGGKGGTFEGGMREPTIFLGDLELLSRGSSPRSAPRWTCCRPRARLQKLRCLQVACLMDTTCRLHCAVTMQVIHEIPSFIIGEHGSLPFAKGPTKRTSSHDRSTDVTSQSSMIRLCSII